MRDFVRSAGAATIMLAGLVVAPRLVSAAEPDPDWPCIQRLVPTLTASQMWAGPPRPDGQPGNAALASTLATRTTPIEQATRAIDQFADGVPEKDRNAQLSLLFHDALVLVNRERSRIIAGIKRYTRKQRRLAAKIAQESRQLGNLQPGTVPDPHTRDLMDARQWDVRVFEDRQKVLRQICEQPVLLDQRAFALSRAMQARLEPK